MCASSHMWTSITRIHKQTVGLVSTIHRKKKRKNRLKNSEVWRAYNVTS
nr:MAG TPA: hypothetical protein [Bacteriophage sp.]